MKKIFYAFAVILLGFASACTNDDIEIKKVGKLHSLTVNINTQNVYDEFDITSNIRELLRDQDYSIGIFTFLYDSNGNLIAKKASQQYTFNNIAETFNDLLESSYTLVTVETLVDPDLKNQAPNWSFEGTEKLATLQISQDSYEVFYPFVIGVSTFDVIINDGDKSISVTPKAIGSLIQFHFLNFDKSTHVKVGFATNDIIASYRLDPNLSSNDRFSTDLTKSGYINLRCIRDVDSDNIGATRYVLESSIQYRYCFIKAEDDGTTTWTNYKGNVGTVVLENAMTYYGGFYYINSSTVPKSYFGDNSGFREWYTQVTTSNNDNGLVPSSVSMNWGGSVTSVQTAMNGYTLTTGSSGRAIIQDNGSYMIDYSGKGKELKILYYFTSATTGLFEADVQYNKSTVSSSEILTYLNANYTYLAEESGIYMYCTSDFKTYVMFFEVNGLWNIGFVDVNYVNNSNIKAYMSRRFAAGNVITRSTIQNIEETKPSLNKPLKTGIPYKNVKNVK